MYDKTPYTPGLREVIKLSKAEAGRLGHDYIGPEHYLLGIIRKGEGLAIQTLDDLEIDLDELRISVEKRCPTGGGPNVNLFSPNAEAKQLLDLSKTIARGMGHSWIGTEHLLLGLVRYESTIAYQALDERGLSYDRVLTNVLAVIDGSNDTSGMGTAGMGTGEQPFGRFMGPVVAKLWTSAAEQAFETSALFGDSGHVLNAMLDHPQSIAGRVLMRLGADPEAIRAAIREEQAKGEMDTN